MKNRAHNKKWAKRKPKTVYVPQALIADDDSEAAQLLQIVLVNFGFETTFAFDGYEALHLMTKKHFDLVFLDIEMPGLSGTDVLAQIQNMQESRQLLPVVTYSGHDVNEMKIPDQKGFYIVDNWQKPISLHELTTLTGNTVAHLGISSTIKSMSRLNMEGGHE